MKKNSKYKEILVMPDPHVKPDFDSDRIVWAARMALQRQPEYIVCLGDFADMQSLSSYDEGRIPAEGQRYEADLNATHSALAQFNAVIDEYNNKHTKWKKKTYYPKKIMCMGNHENRINRWASDNPRMYGHVSTADLKYAEYGWQVHEMCKPAYVEGIAFGHYFTSGIMGRPISGINHARTLLLKAYNSCVVGHSHMRGFYEDSTVLGKKIFGLVAGCYFEHDEHYTTENSRFWRGLVYLRDVFEGQCEPEFLNLENYIKRKFA